MGVNRGLRDGWNGEKGVVGSITVYEVDGMKVNGEKGVVKWE